MSDLPLSRINMGAPMPTAYVTVKIVQPDGKGLEFAWPGAIDLDFDLDFDLDAVRLIDPIGALWELEPTMWNRMEVSFKALPVQDGDPFARHIAMRTVDERAADSGGAGQGLPPVAAQAGGDAAAGTPG